MADLDFALLADYAAVEHGKLNILGGCYTHVRQDQPGTHETYVAGRIRTTGNEAQISLGVSVAAPHNLYQITTESPVPAPEGPTYDGSHKSLVFAARLAVPLVKSGRYEVTLSINAEPVRTLVFEAALQEEQQL